jgi:hypothetical protein
MKSWWFSFACINPLKAQRVKVGLIEYMDSAVLPNLLQIPSQFVQSGFASRKGAPTRLHDSKIT